MKEAFHYFLAADTIAMSPFKSGMTAIFTAFLLISLYLIWKRGLKDIDIICFLLILTTLLRSGYPLFLHDESQDQALRLLFFLFPLSTALLTHFLFTNFMKLRVEQSIIGIVAVLFTIANLTFGGALNPGSPHWWADIYPLKPLNRIWLFGSVVYSTLAIMRTASNKNPYSGFVKIANIALIIYLIGHFFLSIKTDMDMYWIYRYHSFVSDLVIIYAFGLLFWKRYHTIDDIPDIQKETDYTHNVNIFEIMATVPSDKLIYHLEVNYPGSVPADIKELSPRQQLQAMLMIHKVSIKESAEYTFVTPQAVKVYRSRIRKNLT